MFNEAMLERLSVRKAWVTRKILSYDGTVSAKHLMQYRDELLFLNRTIDFYVRECPFIQFMHKVDCGEVTFTFQTSVNMNGSKKRKREEETLKQYRTQLISAGLQETQTDDIIEDKLHMTPTAPIPPPSQQPTTPTPIPPSQQPTPPSSKSPNDNDNDEEENENESNNSDEEENNGNEITDKCVIDTETTVCIVKGCGCSTKPKRIYGPKVTPKSYLTFCNECKLIKPTMANINYGTRYSEWEMLPCPNAKCPHMKCYTCFFKSIDKHASSRPLEKYTAFSAMFHCSNCHQFVPRQYFERILDAYKYLFHFQDLYKALCDVYKNIYIDAKPAVAEP